MQLIDANKISYHKSGFPKGDGFDSRLDWAFREDIDKLPTVDAVEVVHGRWLFITKGQQASAYACSECNRVVTLVCDEDKVEEQLAKKYPYCHCGAKMDGDGNA